MERNATDWNSRSASWWLSLFLGGSLLIFAVIGLFSPQTGSWLYGIPMSDSIGAMMYLPKAIRDGVIAFYLLGTVFLFMPRAAFYVNLGGLPISMYDFLIVTRANPDAWPHALILHGGTIVGLIVTLFLLERQLGRSRNREGLRRELDLAPQRG